MNEYEQKQNRLLTVPVAIIVAGALIAVSVIYTSSPREKTLTTTTETIVKVNPVDESDHILGNPNAPIVIVEYSDTECPFCKNFHTTMLRLADKYGKDSKLTWVYRHMPITNLHPKAWKEAIATECAAEVGGGSGTFWKYINKIYEITPSNDKLEEQKLITTATSLGLDTQKFQSCLQQNLTENKVKRDYENGLNISEGRPGTPLSVMLLNEPLENSKKMALKNIVRNEGLDAFVNVAEDGQSITIKGAFPYEVMSLMIDLILQ